ncbi:AfsR/SARP family transcriptional regulator [Actinomadura rupiterrae]|uniref:AfsR/SARP family transcriptional regulator n=1 Tax=Actinomadura rupiterrae TaxID=559627 RepID=UPI0020A5F96A|nr:BTAD domain-containing putative transcriptional regulator [Actinomadura rupiterrae]MCP2343033.1 putative ATPase/DNA-binding SARP family transcriptional activator [Actinomadura rupiterrae]
MRFGVLGSTAAWRPDGSQVPLGGPARRALLALLLVRPGEAASAEGLADELYGDRPGGDPGHALQSQVSRLRAVLRPDADIEATPAGYRLTATSGPSGDARATEPPTALEVDAERFESLAEDGRNALAAGDAGRAADLLAEALGLWRGPAFADAAEAASGAAAAARLDELRFAALVARAEADLALGRHDAAVAELRDLIARHPLREDLRALLVRALAAGGRQAEALAFYEETRVLLADELGADPSPELVALHRALLQSGPAAPPRPAERPRVARPGTPISGFIGRDDDVAGVLGGLATGRLVTLFGPGGVGKTRLAGEVARRWDGDQPGEVAFAPLAPVADPAQAVLQALGLRERGLLGGGPEPDPEERLVAALADRALLLVLDNCEHVVADAANLAWRLLSECPDLRILATSREPLDVDGERLWQVRPLPQDDAVRLFEERARAARRDVVLDGTLVRNVCEALDDLPLAIELAAARLRTHELYDVAARLDDRFALLARGSRTADARHRTLRAVVDWSWELLTEDERRAARRFTVFAGGATAASARAVARGDEATLDALADRSLLDFSNGRYRMLETIRAYGSEKLAEAGETEEFTDAHAQHLLDLAANADLLGSGQLEALDRLAAEHDDLFAALRRAIDAGKADTASRLLNAMSTYLWIRGLAGSAAPLAVAILDLPESADLPGEEYAVIVTIAGANATDEQRERAASALAEAERPLRNSMAALQWLMNTVGGGDVRVQFRTLMAERESPDPWARAAARLMSGYPQLAQGDLAQAEQEYQDAADGFRALGERWGTALALDALANLAATTGDTVRAIALTDDALALAGELGAADDIADLLCNRGDLRAHDDPETARADYAEAAAVARRAGNATCLAAALRGLADMALANGDKDEAQRLYAEALDHFDPAWVKSVGNRVRTLIGLGRIAEPDPKAADLYRQAVEVAAVIGALSEGARAMVAIARLHEGEQAARMLGAATVLRGMDAVNDPEVNALEQALRTRLGDETYASAYREGLRLSHGDVLRLAGVSDEVVAKSPLHVFPDS